MGLYVHICESSHIGIHARTERRYACHECGKTFAETVGTPLYGLKEDTPVDSDAGAGLVVAWLSGAGHRVRVRPG